MKRLLPALFITASIVGQAFAEDGNWMVRGRMLHVKPLNHGGDASIGGKPHASTDTVPEVDITYFATPNLGFELIAATTEHKMKLDTRPSHVDLGKVKLLPPTLTAQYHHPMGNFKPYVGAGVTYAHFYDVEHPGFNSIKYDDRWGVALQTGVDYKLNDKWYLNADVKQIFLRTEATVNDTIKAHANLNPTIAGVGIGYRF